MGQGSEVQGVYPREHARGFYEGLHASGEDDGVLLCRSAWAGSQRYGAIVWSGDIESTFEALAEQIPSGLNVGVAGIPWWTTDIGGFKNGDPTTAYFRELIVRWFQFGVFCPIFRLHGVREPGALVGSGQTGAPNEVWSFGEEAYAIIREQLALRERLRPYVMEQMATASTTGLPPMRALFLEFPAEAPAWEVSDQYMFGPDVLVAPITAHGARETGRVPPRGRVVVGRVDGRAGRAERLGDRRCATGADTGLPPRGRRAERSIPRWELAGRHPATFRRARLGSR